MKGAGLRYTAEDGVPSWAVGKTADEIVSMTENLVKAVENGQTQQAAPPQTQQAPQPSMQTQTQPNGGTPAGPPNPELAYTNAAEYNRQLQAWQQASTQEAIRAASQPLLTPLAQMARNQARQNPDFKDVWEKYGPEVDAIMQQVPMEQRTNVQMWDQAAEMVAGRHWRELASTEAERLAAQPSDAGTLPTGSGPTAPGASEDSIDPISKLFREDHPSIQRYRKEGIGPERVIAQAKSAGIPLDKYANIILSKSNVRYSESGAA